MRIGRISGLIWVEKVDFLLFQESLMFPSVGYIMDWDWIDECVDYTPDCFLGYDDYMDEVDGNDRLSFSTIPCRGIWDRGESGQLKMSVAMG